MTKLAVTDEELVALADGELDADVAERLHRAITADPDLAERFAILAETRFLLEAEPAGAEAATPAGGPRLVAERAPRAPARPIATHRPRWSKLALPLAASFAFVAGGLSGFVLRGGDASSTPGITFADMPRSAINAALATTASGGEVDLAGSRLRMVASYKLADGRICREYTVQSSSRESGGWDAVDCRDGENWRTEFVAARAAMGAGYAPASGNASADAFLTERGAEALAAEEERALLRGR